MINALNGFLPFMQSAWTQVHEFQSWAAVPALISNEPIRQSQPNRIPLQVLTTTGTIFGTSAETVASVAIPFDTILQEITAPSHTMTEDQQAELDAKLMDFPEAQRPMLAAITYLLYETASVYTQFCCTHNGESPAVIAQHITAVHEMLIADAQSS